MTSTIDKVQEVDSRAKFPEIGDPKTIYVARDTSLVYRWMGTKYAEVHLASSPVEETLVSSYYRQQVNELRSELASVKKNDEEAKAALGIVAAANRNVGYAAMILFVLWLNGWRYVSSGWEMFFSLFGYTVYLSLIRTVDWFATNFGGLFAAIIEHLNRTGGSGI